MGTREYLLDKAKKEGLELGRRQGIERGIEKGIEKGAGGKSYEVVRNMLLSGRFTVAGIITFTNELRSLFTR